MKKTKQIRFLLLLLLMIGSISFAQRNNVLTNQNQEIDAGFIKYKQGPTGEYNYNTSLVQSVDNVQCTVNGIVITTTGSTPSYYSPPSYNNNELCNDIVNPASNTPVIWTSPGTNGYITYTFSEPITSVRISYSAVNSDDVATMSINAPGMQLSNPCGLSISGNVISCTFPAPPTSNTFSSGNVALTVSSCTPFTQVTLQNTGGKSGWVSGNPCNFIIENMLNAIPKVQFFYCGSTPQSSVSTSSLFECATTTNGCSVNGGNATITPVVPTPPFDPNMAVNILPIQPIPSYIIINGDGTISIDPSAQPNFNVEFFIQICSGGSCTIPIRCNVIRDANCNGKMGTAVNLNISPNPSKEGTFNILFGKAIENGFIEVYSLYAEKVFAETLTNQTETILKLNQINKGTYLLKVFDGKETITKTIVKE